MNMKLCRTSREILIVSLITGGVLLAAMISCGAGKCSDIFLMGIVFSAVAALYVASHTQVNVLARMGIASVGVITPFLSAVLLVKLWCTCF